MKSTYTCFLFNLLVYEEFNVIGQLHDFFFCSCNRQVSSYNYPVLKVTLEETQTSLFDIFEKAELIPLETNRESLIMLVTKIKYHCNTFYLLDHRQGALLFFDDTGKYIDKIHRKGQGPGEYQFIYDFFIDTTQLQVGMLSPFGSVFYYDLQGSFIKKVDLPNPPPNYQRVELLIDNNCIFWSATETGDKWDALNIVSMESGEKTGGCTYNENHMLRGWTAHVFHCDEKGNVYFIRGFSNEVFTVTPDGLKIAYAWDFGNKTFDIKKYRLPNTTDRSTDAQRFRQSFDNGEVSNSYHFVLQDQTDLYYYAYMRFAFDKRKHLFYNKKTNNYHFFEHTAEGISIKQPALITDEFMLAELDFNEKEAIAPYLFSEEDKRRLANFKEEDNPCLVKLTFKK